MGAILSISRHGEFIAIETHIDPSASCTLVLRVDLSLVTELYGWVQGHAGEDLLLQGDTVHFAPTHPLRLFVYDPRYQTSEPIYPIRGDAARERFSAALRRHQSSPDWCRAQNNACDPEAFTAYMDHFAVGKAAMNFSFEVVMLPEGFGPEAEQQVPQQTVRYVCRQVRRVGLNRWACGGADTP